MSAIEVLKKILETNKKAMFEDEKKAMKKAILALEYQKNTVCIPVGEIRDLFVEIENHLDETNGYVVRLRKKVKDLKKQVFEQTHGENK